MKKNPTAATVLGEPVATDPGGTGRPERPSTPIGPCQASDEDGRGYPRKDDDFIRDSGTPVEGINRYCFGFGSKWFKLHDDITSSSSYYCDRQACEIFILELTMRAWMQTEENKRRTLGRADIAGAISKNDMYDFLIDLVPRDDTRAKQRDAPQPDVCFHRS
jgi:hypothetical protein